MLDRLAVAFDQNQLAGTVIIEFTALLILTPLTARVVIWQNNRRWRSIRSDIGRYIVELYFYWLRMASLRAKEIPTLKMVKANHKQSSVRRDINLRDKQVAIHDIIDEGDAVEFLFSSYESVLFLHFDRMMREYSEGNKSYRAALDDVLEKMRSCVDDFEFALSPEILFALNLISLYREKVDRLELNWGDPTTYQPTFGNWRGDYPPFPARPMRLFDLQYRFNNILENYNPRVNAAGEELDDNNYMTYLNAFAAVGPARPRDVRLLLDSFNLPRREKAKLAAEFDALTSDFRDTIAAKQAEMEETMARRPQLNAIFETVRRGIPAGFPVVYPQEEDEDEEGNQERDREDVAGDEEADGGVEEQGG